MAELDGIELVKKLDQLQKTPGKEFFPTQDEIESYVWRENKGPVAKDARFRAQESKCVIFKIEDLCSDEIHYYKDL